MLASCGTNKTKSTSEIKPTAKVENSKANANNAFLALFRDYSEEGVKKYIHEEFIPHNPFVPTGRDALIGFLPVSFTACNCPWESGIRYISC
jgi:hypothetical protein